MTRVVLHIGMEKTGTTSFQSYCVANRARHAERGVLYPTNPLCFADDNHAPLVASYFSAAEAVRLAIGRRRADRGAAVDALKAEIDGAPTALISSEHFSSRFDAECIAALADDLQGFETCVAVVLRHPVRRAISSYATAVASGRATPLDEFVEEVCAPSNPYLRARATLEPWAAAFGRERLAVFVYREGGDIVPELLARLLPQVSAEAGGRRNASPPPWEIERRRRANAVRWPALADLLLRWRGAPAASEAARLSREHARRITEATVEDCDWLRREYGVEFEPASDAVI